MATTDVVMYDEEFNQIKSIISKLRVDANAKLVFLVDKNGQQIAAHGNIDNLDTTSLASLTAGNVAATDALAKLIGEKEFSILFHEGRARQHSYLHCGATGHFGGHIRRAFFPRAGPTSRQKGLPRAWPSFRQHHEQSRERKSHLLGRTSSLRLRRSPTRTSTASLVNNLRFELKLSTDE